MTFGERICALRKEKKMTQEALANALGVTNQAVSKWENGQSYPDIEQLPNLADLFGVSIDSLFGRERPVPVPVSPMQDPGLPWPDDNTLRIVVYHGHQLIDRAQATEIDVELDGDALSVECWGSLRCDDISGNVIAGGNVDCCEVSGSVTAAGDVSCEEVNGDVTAGGDVDCGDVEGNLKVGGDADCGSVSGNVEAGGNVDCGSVSGNVSAGGDIDCGTVQGRVIKR